MTTAAGRTPWRVLIVDDEENLNWSLVTSLRKDGYIVDGARTGEEALALLRAAPYDCVVSDIKMPGMDGFELLQWLRQHQPATRMVMITSFGSPSARQDALREGAVAFFEKPFDLRALKDQLRQMSEVQAHAPASVGSQEAGYDLLDVVQVISLSRRDAALEVRGGGYMGSLLFVQGELLWAEAGDLRGDEAFLALCAPRGGHAQVAAWNGRPERNVTQPVARLIYAALARREGRGVAARTPHEPPAPAIAPTQPSPARMDAAPTDELPTVGLVTPAAVPPLAPPEAQALGPESMYLDASEATAPVDLAAPPDAPLASDWTDAASPSTLAPVPVPVPLLVPVPSPAPASPRPPGQIPSPPLRPADLIAALEALANALPAPCGVMWLGADAGLLWQRWRGQPEIPREALVPLHAAVRAAGQASALGVLGALDELRIVAAGRHVILRRGPRGGTLLLSLTPDADADTVADALRATQGGLAG